MPDTVYELLMLGTIADVVPLLDENRYWVRHGLRRQNLFASTALNTLRANGRVTKPLLSSQDIGFCIAPQINALGRLDDPRDGVTFLMSTDVAEVSRIGAILAHLNEARKLVERSILRDIEAELATKDMVAERVIVAASNSWPSGVIGLSASRLVGNYCRPAFLFHLTPEGVAKGSCRSIPAFNLFNALEKVSDMLISFGGHAMAAGLALPAHKLPEFKARMEALVDEQLTPDDLLPTLQMDAHLSLSDVNVKLINDLEDLEPFGCENSVPLFYMRNVTLVGDVQLLKEAHTKCLVFSEGIMKPVIFFNRPDIYEQLKNNPTGTWDMAVHVTQNYWNNEMRVELQGLDIYAHHDA
jgi:single-stranded-DNA-specific exonuclease